MRRRLHSPEQVVLKLRRADELLSGGRSVEDVCKELGISDATYYNWRKQYGQMKVDQVRQLKGLVKENARLKKLVADQALDMQILKEALEGNY
jgi:putative transposase